MTIMFRVLSEEEAAKAIKWKAPDFGSTASHIVHARESVSPVALNSILPDSDAPSLPVIPTSNSLPTSAPALQVAQSQENKPVLSSEAFTNPSVEMLQSSYDDGYAQGYADGSKALQDSKITELTKLLGSLTRATPAAREDDLEREIYGLSIDIARLLVHRELNTDPEALSNLVKAGLEQLPSNASGPKSVYLHPEDVKMLIKEAGEFSDTALIADDSLQRGQCRVQSETSTVHAGVENWLESIAAQFGLTSYSSNVDDAATPSKKVV